MIKLPDRLYKVVAPKREYLVRDGVRYWNPVPGQFQSCNKSEDMPDKLRVTYKPGKIAVPVWDHSRLFVFKDYADAKRFVDGLWSGDDLQIWQAAGYGSIKHICPRSVESIEWYWKNSKSWGEFMATEDGMETRTATVSYGVEGVMLQVRML